MRQQLAFVLSGGGARGALQVGALRALLEARLRPNLLVGTSIGACNAAYLALHGVDNATLGELTDVWRDLAMAHLLPANPWWSTLRALIGPQINTGAEGRMREFYLAHGIGPAQSFSGIQGVRLLIVSTDLNSGQALVHGLSPDESVYEALLASTALPPWLSPVHNGRRLLIDGGVLSNLPIKAALSQGATEVVALDLSDPSHVLKTTTAGFRSGLAKVAITVQRRQLDLELRLAAANGVPVQKIDLYHTPPLPLWDFSHTEELLTAGYEMARAALANGTPSNPTRWWTQRNWLARPAALMHAHRLV